jgi:hypothetical protein
MPAMASTNAAGPHRCRCYAQEDCCHDRGGSSRLPLILYSRVSLPIHNQESYVEAIFRCPLLRRIAQQVQHAVILHRQRLLDLPRFAPREHQSRLSSAKQRHYFHKRTAVSSLARTCGRPVSGSPGFLCSSSSLSRAAIPANRFGCE